MSTKVHVSKLLVTKESSPVDGYVKPGFETVKDLFKKQLDSGFDKGGSFAAYYKGELVVNIWGGYVNEDADQKWEKDTMSRFYTATKSFSSIVIAQLVERGLLDYKERISTYWPEFAQNGKRDITLEMFMSLKAGLSVTAEPYKFMWTLEDPKRLGTLLAKQTPLWKIDGTKFGYHPVTFAMYLDQIVRRVDGKGRGLGQYFQDEIAKPFDIDFYIGCPKELFYRVALNSKMEEIDMNVVMSDFHGDPQIMGMITGNSNDVPSEKSLAFNNTARAREVPDGSDMGHGTAKAAAKFHSILACGGDLEGKHLLSPALIKEHTVPRTSGRDFVLGQDQIWSLGTNVFASKDSDNGPLTHMFGYSGYGGQFVHADPTMKVATAYGSNHIKPMETISIEKPTRWSNLCTSLYECIYKQEKKGKTWTLLVSGTSIQKQLEKNKKLNK